MEMQKVKELKKEVSDSDRPILVEFWSSWCPPCQRMKDTLKELEEKHEDKIKIIKVNPDMNSSFSSEFDIKGLPTFVFFKGGEEVNRKVGAQSKEQLSKAIEEIYEQ